MKSLFIFAGTSEGRILCEKLSQDGFDCTVSTATEYGASLLPKSENLTLLQGRLNHEEMASLFSQKKYDFIIDATHPFATKVSEEIKKACEMTKNHYIRLARKTDTEKLSGENILLFESLKEAASYLQKSDGKIFVTTGSKELSELTKIISEKDRLIVRVMPSIESIKICNDCGIVQKQIIAMQGPFSQKANEVQFAESGAVFLLTKETGGAGGFFQKISAAQKLGMKIAVIKNPENTEKKASEGEIYQNLDEILQVIRG